MDFPTIFRLYYEIPGIFLIKKWYTPEDIQHPKKKQ